MIDSHRLWIGQSEVNQKLFFGQHYSSNFLSVMVFSKSTTIFWGDVVGGDTCLIKVYYKPTDHRQVTDHQPRPTDCRSTYQLTNDHRSTDYFSTNQQTTAHAPGTHRLSFNRPTGHRPTDHSLFIHGVWKWEILKKDYYSDFSATYYMNCELGIGSSISSI